MDKYRTLAANTALISIGTFASKFLLFFIKQTLKMSRKTGGIFLCD